MTYQSLVKVLLNQKLKRKGKFLTSWMQNIDSIFEVYLWNINCPPFPWMVQLISSNPPSTLCARVCRVARCPLQWGWRGPAGACSGCRWSTFYGKFCLHVWPSAGWALSSPRTRNRSATTCWAPSTSSSYLLTTDWEILLLFYLIRSVWRLLGEWIFSSVSHADLMSQN